MIRLCLGLTLTLLLALGAGGCTRTLTVVANPLEIDFSEYPRIYEAARIVLRSQGFELDRQDYRFGVMTTMAQGSPTAVEFWHDANTTPYQMMESTLNSQRRRVTLWLEPQTPPGPAIDTRRPSELEQAANEPVAIGSYLLRIEVLVERLELPARRLSGSTQGNSPFNTLAAVPTELRQRGITGPYWLTIGRDLYLEQRLMAAMVRKSVTLR